MVDKLTFTTRITDPVHGTIFLTDLEREIIGTKAFQRLHNVYQLGLSHLVFPGANYSRFAHSLGTCHISGRLLDAINANGGDLSVQEIQIYRLCALLHDIGHYPFSHSMEHAVKAFYSKQFLTTSPPIGGLSTASALETLKKIKPDIKLDDEPAQYDHELLGKRIITHDEEIRSIIEKHGLMLEDVVQIFENSRPKSLVHLVSSDLDCDRLDYLMRTAHHAGMPYGSVDIDYIISQATIDDKGNFCFRNQALKAADHLLLSRFFDYQQVPFHKTVVAIELLLEEVLKSLFELGIINCHSSDMLHKIYTTEWARFDDQHIISIFRNFIDDPRSSADTPELALKIRSILERRPPKLIWCHERLADRSNRGEQVLQNKFYDDIETKKISWAAETGIPVERWKSWKNSFSITKIGASLSTANIETSLDELEYNRAIRLLCDRSSTRGTESNSIMHFDHSLMAPLSNQLYNSVRLYVLFDENEYDWQNKRQLAIDAVNRDMKQ